MKLITISPLRNAAISASFFIVALLLNSTVSAQSKTTAKPGYDKATYTTTPGKFMKTWLIAGPVSVSPDATDPDNSLQEKAFKEDALSAVNVVNGKPVSPVQVNQQPLQWKLISSANDAVLLDTVFDKKNHDFVYAYALAEIKADKAGTFLLGLGSDDGVKVWLNGKLVHELWAPRGINKDEDVIPLQLVKGTNQLLLKVQDMQGAWGFMARLLDKAALSDQLPHAIQIGNLDKINLLLESGADINAKNAAGLTPIMSATVAGREEIVQLLKKKGAKEEPVPSAEVLVDAMYASLQNKDASGIAVLVSKDGKVLYEKGFGYADIKVKK